MNLLQLSCSTRGRTLSIHIRLRSTPLTLEIDHPLVTLWSHLWKGSYTLFNFANPLYIIENGSPVKQQDEKLITQVKQGLQQYMPEPIEEGVNGAYFMKNEEGQTIAIFKPKDEEGSRSPKKSKDDNDEILDRGIHDGEGIQREVAAYFLDKDHFAGVPETLMAELEIDGATRIGSLQRFVENDGASWDMGPNRFPVNQVHKIGVLDLRIFNNDRHGGNILYRETEDGQYELIPIDHGLSLSDNFEHAWFDWITWPQAKVPFERSTLDYIHSIDIESDAEVLATLGVREECIKTMIISSTLLQKGAAAGLTLFDIASMASRTDLEEPSLLEQMVARATEQAKTSEEFYTLLWRIMDEEISKH